MHAMRAIAREVENKINWVEICLYILFSQKTDVYFKYPTFPPFFHSNETVSYLLIFFLLFLFLFFGASHVLPYIIEMCKSHNRSPNIESQLLFTLHGALDPMCALRQI